MLILALAAFLLYGLLSAAPEEYVLEISKAAAATGVAMVPTSYVSWLGVDAQNVPALGVHCDVVLDVVGFGVFCPIVQFLLKNVFCDRTSQGSVFIIQHLYINSFFKKK